MAGMINQLIEVLNEQAARCEELLGLSREKRDVIITNDVDNLQKITSLENIIVSQNQKLEKKRESLIADIGSVLGKEGEKLTISALAELMEGQEEQQLLLDIRARIQGVMEELSENNLQNASLIQNALDYIEYSMNVLRYSGSQEPPMYTAQGEQITNDTGIFDVRN